MADKSCPKNRSRLCGERIWSRGPPGICSGGLGRLRTRQGVAAINLATIQFHSQALGKHVTYGAILPSFGSGPAPVLMQLHGLSDDHTAWLTYSNLVRHAAKYRLIILLPDGGTSFYLNLGQWQNYETYLMEDLYNHVTATLQVKPGPWAIGGLSMGGFGAMRLGCKYPDRFASVWAHSSAFFTADDISTWPNLKGADLEDGDVFATAARLATAERRPVVTFDCGVDDFLLEQNRRFAAHLTQLDLAHTYREHPGAHDWNYWDLHVQAALAQHARVLGAESKG